MTKHYHGAHQGPIFLGTSRAEKKARLDSQKSFFIFNLLRGYAQSPKPKCFFDAISLAPFFNLPRHLTLWNNIISARQRVDLLPLTCTYHRMLMLTIVRTAKTNQNESTTSIPFEMLFCELKQYY